MLHATAHVNGAVLWAKNLHRLFWRSLTPFVTGWMGDNHLAPLPTAVYGVVLLLSAISYTILQTSIIRHEGPQHSKLGAPVKKDVKGKISMLTRSRSRWRLSTSGSAPASTSRWR